MTEKTLKKLAQLLEQDQFELILPENVQPDETKTEGEGTRGRDIRLVYLMNDAVESFLVFGNARMTGVYKPDYEGEILADLSRQGREYILVVHQDDSVVTLFFETLSLEKHLYDYSQIGHFWVKGYEYLRQLEELAEKAAGENAKKIAKEIAVVKAGIIGEDNILFELKNSGMDMVVLHDLYIESVSGASAQIDFLVLTPKINFVLECKNLFGNIEINSKGDFIRTIRCGGRYYKEGIYSPITQNQRHLQVLKERRSENDGKILAAWKNYLFKDFFRLDSKKYDMISVNVEIRKKIKKRDGEKL